MKIYFCLIVILTFCLNACKQDGQNSTSASTDISSIVSDEDNNKSSTELYAALDRLRIRTDSSMGAGTVVTISEGDTLKYLHQFSDKRLVLKLRGKYYYEPWLNIKHLRSGKKGWVYGGAVFFQDQALRQSIAESNSYLKELSVDDLEWDNVIPSSWSAASFSDPGDFKLFMIKFKDLVSANDASAIADMVHYPIKDIENKQQFIDRYSSIFSDEIKDQVAAQKLNRVFRNSNGAIIGKEDVVFRQVGNNYKIVAMNFQGRADLSKSLMKRLSQSYTSLTRGKSFTISAFEIRNFLELSLNYSTPQGEQKMSSLGKYKHETSRDNQHRFYQSTKDSTKINLRFIEEGDNIALEIYNCMNPRLDGIKFKAIKKN